MTTRKPRWGGGSTGQGPFAHVRLLATTDLHAQLVPWDFYADRPMPGRGLSCLAALIEQARAERPGALLFDNGDFLTGNPLTDEADGVAPMAADGPTCPHPVVMAMNHLHYDAVGLGNHEFSRGLDYLDRSLADARFPVVSANLRHVDGSHPYAPRILLTRSLRVEGQPHAVLHVGVTAALPPQTMVWEKAHLAGQRSIGDILASLRGQVRLLREEGADIVVVLAHSGLAPEGSRSSRMRANVAQAIAAMPGVDVVVAGHTHDALPLQPVMGNGAAALILPGAMASHLGVVDLQLQPVRGRWRIVQSRSELRVVPVGAGLPNPPEDAHLTALTAPARARIRAQLDKVVGHSKVALDTHFALIGRSGVLQFTGRAIRDRMLGLLGAGAVDGPPILAAVPASRAGGRGGASNYVNIAPGPLRERDLGSMVPFDDRLAAIEIRGAELLRWMEHSAAIFRTVAPGAQDANLLDPEVPGFLFDTIDGLDYCIDLSRPAGEGRIRNVLYAGQRVAATDRFILATSSHRLGGGGGFPLPPPRREIPLPTIQLREILRQAVRLPLRAQDIGAAPWAFHALPGTCVTFDTAPLAVSDTPDLQPLGPAPGGFQRFRLHL